MASLLAATEPLSSTLQSVSITDNFLAKLNMCRDEIHTNLRCKQINDHLRIKLISELDQIEKRYNLAKQYENEIKNIKTSRSKIKRNLEYIHLESKFNVFSRKLIARLTKTLFDGELKMYFLREKIEIFADINIAFDTTNNDELSGQTGHLILTQDWDYNQYTHSVICDDKYLSYRGIAIDNNDNIYVVNNFNTISVFSMSGEFLRQIGIGLRQPWGITVHNDYLYITGRLSLYKYTLAGEPVNSVTCYGADTIHFDYARGVHFNYNKGLLFVCDIYNNCIPVFNENLVHQSTLSHDYIRHPVDINTKHQQVYILTKYVLHVLSEEGTYLKQITTMCTNAYFFILDNYNNIIICDCNIDKNIIIQSLYNNNIIKYRLSNRAGSYGIAVSKNNTIINLYGYSTLQLFTL